MLEGIFYNGHGLAEGNRILLRILEEAGNCVRIVPRDMKEKYKVLPASEIQYISSFENTVLPSNDIYLYNWTGTNVSPHPDFSYNIVRTTFETDRIPEAWVPALNRFDEVWVQSSFNESTFRNSGVKVPIRLIPNFFDTSQFIPAGPKLELSVKESFLFLSVFDLKQRKGYDVLLEAFLSEFSADDNVALVIKNRDTDRSDKIEAILNQHPKRVDQKPSIYVIEQMLSPQEMFALYRSCDAFVLPTRGEGWGRPFFEAMLMEIPVIGTKWSGHMDFMRSDNAYLVDVERLSEIEDSENPLFNGHRWAEPSVADLRSKMRHVTRFRKAAKDRARLARSELLQKYSKQQTADKVISHLSRFHAVAAEQNQ
jgi:glycosyltransferase involved in cell wall biosynthesis